MAKPEIQDQLMGSDSRAMRPGRQLVAAAVVFLGYVLAADLWRFGSNTPAVDDGLRPMFKALGIGVVLLLILVHVLLAERWARTPLGAGLWSVGTLSIAAATTWGLQTSWGHRCNQCSAVGAMMFVGLAAFLGAVVAAGVSVLARGIGEWRRRTA